jgi:hypothetical protein
MSDAMWEGGLTSEARGAPPLCEISISMSMEKVETGPSFDKQNWGG